MTDALDAAITSVGKADALLAATLPLGRPLSEIKSLMAYKIRVMLSHLRGKFDNSVVGSPPPPGLAGAWEKLSSGWHSARKNRRQERLGSRPHPFVCFRQAETLDLEEPGASAAQPLAVVSKYFDGRVAKLLREDGTESHADDYRRGPNGFAVAVWLEDVTWIFSWMEKQKHIFCLVFCCFVCFVLPLFSSFF